MLPVTKAICSKRLVCLLTFSMLWACATAWGDELAASPFNGRTLAGWTTLDGQPITRGWEVADGVIHLNVEGGQTGSIITTRKYGDFVLSFEWKIASGGNSGLKYRVRSNIGCEYQIVDDELHRNRIRSNQLTGALYDVYEPNDTSMSKPAGQFNSTCIFVYGNRIEHWLNGRRIVVARVGSNEWLRRLSTSKFHDKKNFGTSGRGRIMLTDHGSEVWYRNFKINEIRPSLKVVDHIFASWTVNCRPFRLKCRRSACLKIRW